MLDFDFLGEKQIFGEKKLDIFKKYGTKAAITDFSILLGGDVIPCCYTDTGKDIAGTWWTKTADGACTVNVVGASIQYSCLVGSYNVGVRPSFDASKHISEFNVLASSDDILRVSYGEYPQMVADKETCKELTDQFYNRGLKETGRFYIILRNSNYDGTSLEQRFFEHEYNGNRYVGFVGDKHNEGKGLSDGQIVSERKIYWVRVEPIVWLVDRKTNIALSEKILFSGVQFCNSTVYDRFFNKTHIKFFIDNYFAKEIVASKDCDLFDDENNVLESDDVSAKNIELENPYKFNLDSVTEDNIIRGCIKSGVPVFLHGASSEGKSARVKQIDPKLVKLSLAGITPEKLNGRSVYNSVKDVMEDKKPTWLERLEEICASEPSENHILFLDELSNALPSIQGMVYHLVLDREVNDRWPLPDNARIVLAGNEMKDSLAANKVVEPLFNRCAHVYIKTDLKDWLIWASENNIHPSIYSFMVYTNGRALRSKFDGEKPNADPRKWEMASKVLYSTCQPEMIRSLVGKEITREFCEFCNQKVITLDDVLKNNYDSNYLSNLNTAEKYATVVGLSCVDKNNLEIVRDFVNNLGQEFVSVFDSIWCSGNEERLEIIAEMKMNQKVKKL